jgi:hypothetical protein
MIFCLNQIKKTLVNVAVGFEIYIFHKYNHLNTKLAVFGDKIVPGLAQLVERLTVDVVIEK